METIHFLNKGFFENSAYYILLAISLVYILISREAGKRAKRLAVYTLLCLVFILWNPLVTPFALMFFGDDLWAYLRIFYILPIMTLIAYAATLFYTSNVKAEDARKKKAAFLGVIVITIIASGATLSKTLYRRAENIYKINGDALAVSDIIREDCGGEHVVAWVPAIDDMVYGIRQYMGCIEIGGDAYALCDDETLLSTMEEQEFTYLVYAKNMTELPYSLDEYFSLTGESDDFVVYKRTGGL